MKGTTTVLTFAMFALSTVLAVAQPPGKGQRVIHKALRTVDDFEAVQKGETLGYVCLQWTYAPSRQVRQQRWRGMCVHNEIDQKVCSDIGRERRIRGGGPRRIRG